MGRVNILARANCCRWRTSRKVTFSAPGAGARSTRSGTAPDDRREDLPRRAQWCLPDPNRLSLDKGGLIRLDGLVASGTTEHDRPSYTLSPLDGRPSTAHRLGTINRYQLDAGSVDRDINAEVMPVSRRATGRQYRLEPRDTDIRLEVFDPDDDVAL